MKLFSYSFLFLLFLANLLFQAQSEPLPDTLENTRIQLTEEEKAWIDNNPILNVAIGLNKLPYEANNKQKQGMIYDVLNKIGSTTGLQFQYIDSSFDQHLEAIKNGSMDLLPVVYKTKERENFIYYTKPYYKSLDYIFVRKGIGVNNFESLRDKKYP